MRRKILTEMESIVDAVIAQAKQRRYLDAKFLFQLAELGSIKEEAEEASLDGDALAERFLREFAGLQRDRKQAAVVA